MREGVKPAAAGRTVSLDSASRFRERDGESLGRQVARLHAVATNRARVSVEAKGDLEKPIFFKWRNQFYESRFRQNQGKI